MAVTCFETSAGLFNGTNLYKKLIARSVWFSKYDRLVVNKGPLIPADYYRLSTRCHTVVVGMQGRERTASWGGGRKAK